MCCGSQSITDEPDVGHQMTSATASSAFPEVLVTDLNRVTGGNPHCSDQQQELTEAQDWVKPQTPRGGIMGIWDGFLARLHGNSTRQYDQARLEGDCEVQVHDRDQNLWTSYRGARHGRPLR
jgi:hypothetical protein